MTKDKKKEKEEAVVFLIFLLGSLMRPRPGSLNFYYYTYAVLGVLSFSLTGWWVSLYYCQVASFAFRLREKQQQEQDSK